MSLNSLGLIVRLLACLSAKLLNLRKLALDFYAIKETTG